MTKADKEREAAILKASEELLVAKMTYDTAKETAKAARDAFKMATQNHISAMTAEYETLYNQE